MASPLSEAETQKLADILTTLTEHLKTIPPGKLPTDLDALQPHIFKALSLPDIKFLVDMGDKLSHDQKNKIMLEVFRRTGRYVIKEYQASFEDGIGLSFDLYEAAMA